MRTVIVLKGTPSVHALIYVTSLGLSYFAWHRLGGDHTDGMYGIPYVVNW